MQNFINIVKVSSRALHSKVHAGEVKLVPTNLDDCELYLPFEEKSYNLSFDHSGHERHGIVYGAVTTTGKVGQALSFDGIDDYINCGNVANMGVGSLSLVVWFYAIGDVTYGAQLIGKQNNYNASSIGYGLYYRQDNKYLAFSIQDGINGARIYKGTYNYNTWYCVAGTYDGISKKLILYVNGVKQDELVNLNIGNIDNSLDLRLGYSGSHAPFKGKEDEARVFNRVLSEQEVLTIYQQES